MALVFFLDQCVPSSVAQTLKEVGHTVHCLRDHLPTNSPDAAVIQRTQELDAILVSLNGDFADIVAYPPE